jgi:acyl-coenzyme A synthetase/AMP-(fatty) acid ligase
MRRRQASAAAEERASIEAAPLVLPIVRPAGRDAVIAFRQRHPIRLARFLNDVAALAARLPTRKYVLNLCTDRYRFLVGFAAALCRRQVSLLPPNDASAVLASLAADYPDLYCLADAPNPLVPGMIYPDDLGEDAKEREVPVVPAAQIAVILFTSGSTGRPKPAAKSWGTLVRSALAAGTRLGVEALRGASVIGTVPHQHSYGLESTIMLALQHGLAIDARRPLYPGDIRATIESAPRPRILVTTPVHIRALLAEADGMPPVDLLMSATAPLSSTLAAEAEACFGAPLLEIYGCTEAGQIAVRRSAHEAEWHCLGGVELKHSARANWVCGPSVETETLLQDDIERTGPGRFLLRGRVADLVDVAGKHTSLAHLNHQLLSIDGVQDGVFLMPERDEMRVARPMAFVVAPGLRAETVLQALRDRIDVAFLPRPLVFVETLPRNALGKLPREALLQLAARSRCS